MWVKMYSVVFICRNSFGTAGPNGQSVICLGSDASSTNPGMRGRIIGVILLLLCGGAAWLWWLRLPREPTYQGRSLSDWLEAPYRHDATWWPGREGTERAIRAMGTNAVPFLLDRVSNFGTPPSKLKLKLAYWLQKYKLGTLHLNLYGQERWHTAVAGFDALRPCADEVVPLLIKMYEHARQHNDSSGQYSTIRGMGLLGSSAQQAIPFLLKEVTNTNASVRISIYWALGMICTNAEVVVPALIKGLEDQDLSVRESAANALGRFGPEAREAIPALKKFLEEENAALKSLPYVMEHRMAKVTVEHALERIEGEKESFSNSGSPEPGSGFGSKQASKVPWQNLTSSLAYKHVAIARMLAEANDVAERLGLQMPLPIERNHIRYAYVGPPRLLGLGGAVDTDCYSFSFDEAGRLCFVTALDPFGRAPLIELQNKLARIEANMTTNDAYQLATNWLVAMSVDLTALEDKFHAAVQQHFFYGPGMKKVMIPIFDVSWGEIRKPAVIVTIYAPTRQLLQLRQNDTSFSRRPIRLIKEMEKLLAIPDEEFMKFTPLQKSNLVAQFCVPGTGKLPE